MSLVLANQRGLPLASVLPGGRQDWFLGSRPERLHGARAWTRASEVEATEQALVAFNEQRRIRYAGTSSIPADSHSFESMSASPALEARRSCSACRDGDAEHPADRARDHCSAKGEESLQDWLSDRDSRRKKLSTPAWSPARVCRAHRAERPPGGEAAAWGRGFPFWSRGTGSTGDGKRR